MKRAYGALNGFVTTVRRFDLALNSTRNCFTSRKKWIHTEMRSLLALHERICESNSIWSLAAAGITLNLCKIFSQTKNLPSLSYFLKTAINSVDVNWALPWNLVTKGFIPREEAMSSTTHRSHYVWHRQFFVGHCKHTPPHQTSWPHEQ